jgi:hypothetical protein
MNQGVWIDKYYNRVNYSLTHSSEIYEWILDDGDSESYSIYRMSFHHTLLIF